jgi:hypothetical protein
VAAIAAADIAALLASKRLCRAFSLRLLCRFAANPAAGRERPKKADEGEKTNHHRHSRRPPLSSFSVLFGRLGPRSAFRGLRVSMV